MYLLKNAPSVLGSMGCFVGQVLSGDGGQIGSEGGDGCDFLFGGVWRAIQQSWPGQCGVEWQQLPHLHLPGSLSLRLSPSESQKAFTSEEVTFDLNFPSFNGAWEYCVLLLGVVATFLLPWLVPGEDILNWSLGPESQDTAQMMWEQSSMASSSHWLQDAVHEPVYLSSLRYPDNILLLLPNASPLGD